MMKFPIEDREEAYTNFRKKHKLCPKCKSSHISTTLLGVVWVKGKEYVDNINYCNCSCGWNGKIIELLPEEVKTNEEGE